MVLIAFGGVAGAVLAFRRYPFFLLVPLVGFLAASASLVGLIEGSHGGAIAVEVLGSLAAPQLVYLAVSLTDDLPRSARLLPLVQTAIGQQLRAQLEVPRRPPEIAVRVRQLRHANHIRNVEVL